MTTTITTITRAGRTGAAVSALLCGALLLAGCTMTEQPSTTTATRSVSTADSAAVKTGDGTERHNLEPLTRRFPLLASATAATWFSGTLGTSGIGPSTYWIDAVVTLPPAEYDRIRALADQADVPAPDVVADLSAVLSGGPYVGGSRLDAELSAGGYSTTAVLDDETRRIILSTVFS